MLNRFRISALIVLFSVSFYTQAQNKLWAWGANNQGAVGDGSFIGPVITPKLIDSGTAIPQWVYISAETASNLGIKANGSLWAWGSGTQAQLGNDSTGTNNIINTPILIDSGIGIYGKWVQVDMGGTHSLGIREDGSLWAWGSNTYGKLGDGTMNDKLIPTLIDAGTGVNGKWAYVDAGLSHSTALRADSTLWTWGYNQWGQLGIGSLTPNRSMIPVMVDSGTGPGGKFIFINTTAHHIVGIKANGSLWAWGLNTYGNVGNNSQVDMPTITMIDPGTGTSGKWIYTSAGFSHTVALRADSSLWGWGRNQNGQLADANTANKLTPVMINNGADGKWILVEAGQQHSMGIRLNKTFWAWGNNANGQLGDGTQVSKSTPTHIAAMDNLINPVVRGGISHTLILQKANDPSVSITYTFTGNGNWSNAANWSNGIIPPSPLPAGQQIIINPTGSGECFLNISQTIASGGKLTVATGKKLTVPGNLIAY